MKRKLLAILLTITIICALTTGCGLSKASSDSDKIAESEVQIDYRTADLANASVGDTILYGSYEQDNKTSNGKEDIEWIVLEKYENQILVISKYALDYQPYNTEDTSVTWETCTLRNWLNSTFLNEAFTKTEQIHIPTVTVSADKNPRVYTDAGSDTQDQIFLLSITEVENLFYSDSARQCEATAYAKAQGVYTNSDNGNCCWWLRSPGDTPNYAACVYNYVVDYYGIGVYVNFGACRPALWINL